MSEQNKWLLLLMYKVDRSGATQYDNAIVVDIALLKCNKKIFSKHMKIAI